MRPSRFEGWFESILNNHFGNPSLEKRRRPRGRLSPEAPIRHRRGQAKIGQWGAAGSARPSITLADRLMARSSLAAKSSASSVTAIRVRGASSSMRVRAAAAPALPGCGTGRRQGLHSLPERS